MEVKVLNEIKPVIEINFDQMKTALTETLEKYNGIVVTEETLSGCKATQKELAGVRTKIDRYRIDKKKELSKPITAFENQCKELISLIEKAERPIKDGIKVFDDKKRAEKREVAEKLIKEVAESLELREKYTKQLTVDEKYCNLTAKESDVRGDLEARAMALLSEQQREDELMEIIKDCIETENERIEAKLKFEDFQRLIDRGMPTKDILAEVRARAEQIYRAENPPEPVPEPEPEPMPEPEPELMPEPITEPEPVEIEESTYYANYRITGTEKQLKAISQFLRANGITYKVTDQGQI